MAETLLIAGLIVTVVSVAMVAFATFEPRMLGDSPTPAGGPEGIGPLRDSEDAVRQLSRRLGAAVIVATAGLTLVGLGAYVEARDAKEAADRACKAAVFPTRPNEIIIGDVGCTE